MTLEEMAETKEGESILPAYAVRAKKAARELMEALVEQVKRR